MSRAQDERRKMTYATMRESDVCASLKEVLGIDLPTPRILGETRERRVNDQRVWCVWEGSEKVNEESHGWKHEEG